jgi:hypothetical protein
MDASDYQDYVCQLEAKLQRLQVNFIAQQDEKAQLIGPLLAITMLVKSDLLPFARDRYSSIMVGPQWKMAEDYVLVLRDEVEFMLTGPNNYYKRQVG